jgi:hypothetical protein
MKITWWLWVIGIVAFLFPIAEFLLGLLLEWLFWLGFRGSVDPDSARAAFNVCTTARTVIGNGNTCAGRGTL